MRHRLRQTLSLVMGLALGLTLALAPVQAQAQVLTQADRVQSVIAQLEAEGYQVTGVRRSWLGRIIITALDADSDLREVVLNRASGEILRDRVFVSSNTKSKAGEGRPDPERPDPERPERNGPDREGPSREDPDRSPPDPGRPDPSGGPGGDRP